MGAQDINPLDLVSVEKLLSNDKDKQLRFYVPSYQRGYRWSAQQVEQLIDDLMEFATRTKGNESAFYCLQPLVVKETKVGEEVYLEVVDGQQRLTTILLILQALRQKDKTSAVEGLPPEAFSIKYETRAESKTWLPELGAILFDKEKYEKFEKKNCDYSHFAEVFKTAYEKLGAIADDFKNILLKKTKFIWYCPTENSGSNVDIFDRLNAGKISLNNAELIKALLLQSNNTPEEDKGLTRTIALEWDAIEKRMNESEFWGFIYSAMHHFEYESHIEYVFDLLAGKKEENKDDRFFTFNQYQQKFREEMNNGGNNNADTRMKWVKEQWMEVKEVFDTLNEWFADRKLFHRIGFILEYVKGETILSLKTKLRDLTRDARIRESDKIISEEVGNIASEKLFHGRKELSEILFLYNILLEDRRYNKTARFSFADYKGVKKDKGWDQEHVASHIDYTIKLEDRKELAVDLIELITGHPAPDVEKLVEEQGDESQKNLKLNKQEFEVCQFLLRILNEKEDETISQEELERNYEKIISLMNGKEDPFRHFDDGKDEKDFIWNFVLLNSGTNRSYGNHIYPVKRKRILADEFNVYTPIGTRNVFEKAYSRRINQMLSWTRTDALAYWNDIKAVVKDYVELKDIR